MDVFELSLQAINNNLQQLEVVSQNVANINTPGYLKAVPFGHYLTSNDESASGQVASGQLVALNPGTIRDTGRELDMAVVSEGFFQVELNGQPYITRGGHFYLDGERLLRHPSGGFVLGEAGRIYIADDDITLTAQGDIQLNGVNIDRLALVKPLSHQHMVASGHGLYQVDAGQLKRVDGEVRQQALNSANVNPSEEMVRMIEISRHLQTNQKVVNAYDQLLNVGINELGKK